MREKYVAITRIDDTLLLQIVCMITNKDTMYYNSDASNTVKSVRATRLQHVEIMSMFLYYKRLFREEIRLFERAFIQKHNLFRVRDDGEDYDNVETMSQEEINCMWRMVMSMSDNMYRKQLQ